MNTAAQLISLYQLLPHPEGGYYKETYRSSEMVAISALPERFGGNRSFSTAIFFLLERGNFSAFHKIKSDECWHFYAGQTLLVHILQSNGELQTVSLGANAAAGELFQFVVPANCWFASEPSIDTEFTFTGCTVSPGFDFEDFELAKTEELVSKFPAHAALIRRLCRQ
ncbi:cupin domain-containing protein [Pseudoflavitalea rhizosphaerae]|uniref:cupin domain-containing protein n=1 Tax=Pseudoflavitalea rhizosphaerae TaxID=1884793 RepID=UPI000F8E0A2F|nr:cupin domain-containing protein [Pseudoflavitalea rhizosphaerae]